MPRSASVPPHCYLLGGSSGTKLAILQRWLRLVFFRQWMLENCNLNMGKMAKLLRTAATAFFFTLLTGSVLAAERVGSTIAAQSTVSGEGLWANGSSPPQIRSTATNVSAPISRD